MSRVAGAVVHKIAVSIAGKPATLIVARDPQTARAAIFLNAPLPIAIELSPEAHADLLQALSFPPPIPAQPVIVHDPDCDVLDQNPDGIKKPCNCGAIARGA